MKICILVSAERGLRCLSSLCNVLDSKKDELTVFTFPEAPWEPPFVNDILTFVQKKGIKAFVATKVHEQKYSSYWSSGIDIIFVVGWRYLIPKDVYDSASMGCFVFHDSLLPEYRGFGPTVWAIRNGASYSGTTLFKISEGMDEGPILFQKKIEISPSDYISNIVEKITIENEKLIQKAFLTLKKGEGILEEQEHSRATYTCKNIPEDFQLDWAKSAYVNYNLIRSYSKPYPGAFSFLKGEKVVIWNADLESDESYIGFIPGRVKSVNKDGSISVFCGDGLSLKLNEVSFSDHKTFTPNKLIKSVGDTFEQ